jgi:hypothetical protein
VAKCSSAHILGIFYANTRNWKTAKIDEYKAYYSNNLMLVHGISKDQHILFGLTSL